MAAPSPGSREYGEVGASQDARAGAFASRLDTTVRTIVSLAVLPLALLLHCLAGFVLGSAGVPPRRTHRVYTSFGNLCMRVGGTRLRVAGAERLPPGEAFVVVANHESNWDPPALLAALPDLVLRFITKHEFMRIPVLGAALRVTGNVEVMRRATSGDVGRIKAAMGARDPEVSILFFAEGTRSRDGGLHPFKTGAFATAIGYGLPVLPIGLAGTRPIWGHGFVRIRRGTVAVEVGDPIPVDALGYDDRGALRERAHEAVAALRTRARRRLRAEGILPGGVD